MSPHLRELLALLNSREVRYLVIGGYALAAHGAPRYTKDLDLWVDIASENLSRLADALREFGFDEAAERATRLKDGHRLLQLGSEPNRVDLLNFASGVEFDPCYETLLRGEIDGVPVTIIDKDSFIRNKKASGRLTDLADLQRLGVKLDRKLIANALEQPED